MLNKPVLVLNRLWQAVNVCGGRRALALLYTGHAEVVYEEDGAFETYSFEEWCLNPPQPDIGNRKGEGAVRTVSLCMAMPRVILLHVFDRLPSREVKFTRENVFHRDRNTCQYCGRRFDQRELNIDHVVPRQQGGQTAWTNVVCSCRRCNARKRNRTPQEAGMQLIRGPRKPRWRPFVESQFRGRYDDSWRHFLDLSRWQVDLGEG